MICNNCKKPIPADSKFCHYCGTRVILITQNEIVRNKAVSVKSSSSDEKTISENIATSGITVNKEDREKLQKIYKNAGDSSIALGVLGIMIVLFFIIASAFSIDETTAGEYLPGVIILSFLIPPLIPFVYFGRKLKKDGLNNLNNSMKISRNMSIYTTVLIVILFLIGIFAGFLCFLLLYYYYKSYSLTKKVLQT